ncbi:tryptophan--tRNA ligase [Hamiltosporidium magnivora]|uniref:Tryptophan--tRNA ligase, cytoplasmic n=1 Tax=Hamiltosporidium magnivora TaxID=148818 RepID=A0A4Q9LDC1_9MICR|nr:tryptophan--tRNA ligase [Hamiltosporidium magnivora]
MDSEQKITPWEVTGEIVEGKNMAVDYEKIIKKFGCQKIDEAILKRIEKIIKKPVHHLLRRLLVFAHRDFDKILDLVEKNKKFYLYTGRGPSSQSMHLGHAVPFLFCKYLQDIFDVHLVIQITDDEKYLWKDLSLEDSIKFGKENMKDIIAFGFNPQKTFIFSNIEYSYKFIKNSLRISKHINLNEATKVFGFDSSSNIGQIEFPSKEIAPCFSSSFDFLEKNMMCLIPAAIDQDPYFRLARDKAGILKEPKPATLYSGFLPDLKGLNTKMSASDTKSSIYLTDSDSVIKNKINKYAFSGGKDTLEEHRKYGGNIDVDVPFHYLKYFEENDEELEKYRTGYLDGSISTGEMKKKCIQVLQKFISNYRKARENLTDEIIDKFTAFSK